MALALACVALACPPAARGQGSTVTISGRGIAGVGITGFGDTPLARSPLQASAFGAQQLGDAGIASIGALTRLDASLGDAYNAEGYWSILAARGYTLDNRFNYRRDGLPINAETALALDNKDRLELLKGTSGIQAGTSAPGGLVNLVVKRPAGSLRSARLEVREHGSLLGAVDIGERFGTDGALGLRINAAYERLDPQARHTEGQRSLLAVAADWQIAADTLLQAEIESSHQRQPSVAGFSMLGNTVPDARRINPRINLNDQPWRQPVVMDGDTASLRLQQRLADGWRLTAHAMQQRLKSDDRTAFPYGVYDANYECPQWCDRYATDGSFTYWEYISDNEHRTSRALSLALAGQWRAAGIEHQLETGVLFSRYRGRYADQVFDIAGSGHIDGSLQTPPSAGTTDANTNRDERNTELFVRDAMRLATRWQLWAGVRHTRLARASERTSPAADGLRATRYEQQATLPWLALAHQWAPRTLLYASWGQGLESEVAPNRARYSNRGLALPALKSRQFEAGIKREGEQFDAALAVFDISRPQAADIGACAGADSCLRALDGTSRHRGIEASGTWRVAAWTWQASAMRLDAQRRGSKVAAINGTRPVNVPTATLRLGAEATVAAIPGLAMLANISAESNRVVLPYDESVTIPGWARLDLGARWRQALGAGTLVWRLGVDNATQRRAWKESPYQFGHVYLYPLAPRTWRASVQASF
jgi:iron complex outermembrane receptor protein